MKNGKAYQVPSVSMTVLECEQPLCGSKTPIQTKWETEDYIDGSEYGDAFFDNAVTL